MFRITFPLQKNFYQEGSNLVHGRILSWHKASWKPALHTHLLNEEEHKAVFAKSDVKNQDS